MGENATEKTEATVEKKDKKAKKEADTTELNLTPHEHIARQKKVNRWTLELCKKTASRFDSRDAWAKGAPSCYKSAVARGWEAECLKGLKAPEGKAPTPPSRRSPTRAA